MVKREIDLSAFPQEREKRLKEIFRYSLFEVTLYRSNLWEHEHRVSWLVEEISPLLSAHLQFDAEKARTQALVHDDAEIITGDAQAGQKAQMSKEELAALDHAEEEAIEELSAKYPKQINEYEYRDLLRASLRKDSPEAQLVSYADKLDAYGETFHDLLGGNITLLTSAVFYTRFFAQVRSKLPLIADALDAAGKSPLVNPFIVSPPVGEQITVAEYRRFAAKPHSKDSIRVDTGYFPFYDAWKRIILARGGEEGESWLLTQREFMPV